MSTLLEAALSYARLGLPVFPLKPRLKEPLISKNAGGHGHKDATTDEVAIRAWWAKWPDANIGIRCDELLVPDLDGYAGQETQRRLTEEHGDFPATWVVRTGGGTEQAPKEQGLQLIFRAPANVNIRPGAGKYGYPGLDIRANDSYVVAVPSITRLRYETLAGSPDKLAPAPAWLIELAMSGNNGEKHVFRPITELKPGQRHADLISFIGRWRGRGFTESEIQVQALSLNATSEVPLREAEVLKMCAQYRGSDEPSFNLTDMGNAERLVRDHQDKVRFCVERGEWLSWTGSKWGWDTAEVGITKLAKQTVRRIYGEAEQEPNEGQRKALADHAKRSESDAKIKDMISLAQSEVAISLNELDCDQWLFNVQNGTIDLRTGTLRAHDPADLITQIAPVSYDAAASSPCFTAFLDKITRGDSELQGYMARIVGSSLTGSTRDQKVFVAYGGGSNGKSTFCVTIRDLFGDYAVRINPDEVMLMKAAADNGGAREGLVDLKGKRLAVASEIQEGRKLNMSLIKDLSGGESIKARRLYSHNIEFKPNFKLLLSGNYKPAVSEMTLAAWRRLRLIPFTVTIPDAEMDAGLPDKLRAEFPGILNWAVRGCLDWQRNGLGEADAVKLATDGYHHESDILAEFIEDCCIMEEDARIPKAELRAKYEAWALENKQDAIGQKTFKSRLLERGLAEDRVGHERTRCWAGIRLRTDRDADGMRTELYHLGMADNSGGQNRQTLATTSHVEKFTENGVRTCPLSAGGDGELPDCHCGVNSWVEQPDGSYYCRECCNVFELRGAQWGKMSN
ncbi:MAG: bifunctional DNA primase/polymerase [Chloroflexi bacterium]|nr:bifunctional DNA primase/polymerase [Chloroflexota bacterium]